MKRSVLFLFLFLAVQSGIQAQWVSKTYTLSPGWSSIWLPGDATYDTVGNLFPSAVTQVWRWNPNPNKIQFIQSPSDATAESEEWTVWKRDGSESKLSRIIGNSAYLVFNSASSNQTLSLSLFPRPPSNSWLISGANFMGFPALQNSKNFSQYFASFINSGKTGLPADTKVYKYIGGNLSSSNPALLDLSANSSEFVSPTASYWFSMPAVSDFSGPLSYEMASSDGLAFGRSVTMLTLGIKNRTTTTLTCNFTLESSATAPSGRAEYPQAECGRHLNNRECRKPNDHHSRQWHDKCGFYRRSLGDVGHLGHALRLDLANPRHFRLHGCPDSCHSPACGSCGFVVLPSCGQWRQKHSG